MRYLARLTCFILITAAVSLPTLAQSRHALVIGNDTYPGNKLQNARNDATSVYEAFTGLGYESTLVLDADRLLLSDNVDKFVDSLNPGDTAVLYYAGHGFQLEGENYLVPVDFKVVSPEVAKNEGYALSSILERMTSHGATTQIVILDACRDNPFLGTRSIKGGWAGFGTSAGSFLAFGTSPGSTASDDPTDGHGLFTKDLLKYLITSNQDIEDMFRTVREDVIRDSNGKQVPWVASSLIGTYHIRPEQDVTDRLLPTTDDKHMELFRAYDRSLKEAKGRSGVSLSDKEDEEQRDSLSSAVDLARGGKIDASIAVLKEILSLNPYSQFAMDLLSLLMHAGGRDVEALDTLNRALTIDPKDVAAASYRCAIEQLSSSPLAQADCSSIHPSPLATP